MLKLKEIPTDRKDRLWFHLRATLKLCEIPVESIEVLHDGTMLQINIKGGQTLKFSQADEQTPLGIIRKVVTEIKIKERAGDLP